MQISGETNMTQIDIGPDGRMHIFGASQEMIALLEALGWQDDRVRRRQQRSREQACGAQDHQNSPKGTHLR